MTELKRCPFCGGEATLVEGLYNDRLFSYVSCDNDNCNAKTGRCDTNDEAITRWNNRPNPWHTGTPTEEGLYTVYYLDEHNPSATPYEVLFDGFLSPDGEGNWIDRDGEIWFIDDDIVHWQKIEEKSNDRT